MPMKMKVQFYLRPVETFAARPEKQARRDLGVDDVQRPTARPCACSVPVEKLYSSLLYSTSLYSSVTEVGESCIAHPGKFFPARLSRSP